MKHLYLLIIALTIVSFSCHPNSGQVAQDTETKNMEENWPDGVYHFHFDHIGGMMMDGKASFPQAEIYFSAAEPQAWSNDENVQTMLSAYRGHTHPFETNETILNGIVAKSAQGHTPGHTIYQIGNVLIIGDLLHAAALQLPHPEFCARYDQDKPTAVKTRKAFYQYVEDNHLAVAGMHLPKSALMKNFPDVEE